MRSYVLANDRVMATLDRMGRLRELYHPLPGGPGLSLGRPARMGMVVEGVPLWLDELGIEGESERLGLDLVARQVLRVRRPALELRVETWIDQDLDLICRSFAIRGEPGQTIDLLLQLDLAIGGHDYGDGVRAEAGGVLHWKGPCALVHRFEGPGADAGWTLGRRDREGGVIGKFERGGLDRDPCAVGAGESLIARRLVLDPEGRAQARSVIAFLEGPDAVAALPPEQWRRPTARSRQALVVSRPPALDEDLAAAFTTSLAHLSAFFAPVSGAVIASPDTEGMAIAREHYGYVWPRDAALDCLTLMRLGLAERCDPFLDFCRRHRHPEGWFHQRLNADGTPASSWHPRRPDPELRPIQSDETALVVLAAATRVSRGGPRALFDDLLVPATEFLLRYRDPRSHLPLPSHDLWEERFGVHTFTVCATIAALRAAAAAGAALGEVRADWEEAARAMHRGLRQGLYHESLGRFARRGETGANGDFVLDMTIDSSLAALFLFELEGGLEAEVESTMAAIEEKLLLRGAVVGVARYDDDHYHRRALDPARVPGNPWLISTLWLARWRLRRGDRAGCRELIDSVLELAAPSGALPEQVHPLTGRSVSVQPLAWSHAELLDTLLDYADA